MKDSVSVVRFIVDQYFDGDEGAAASAAGFSKQQVQWWLTGSHKPRLLNVKRLVEAAVVPDFHVIFEYAAIDYPTTKRGLKGRINEMFGEHMQCSGVYGFYDSMAQLIYVGKSDGNLADECYQRLNASVEQTFPKGVRQPARRRDVVRYISAYWVRSSDSADHAKHVESLILRLSKPRLNKNIGSLKSVY